MFNFGGSVDSVRHTHATELVCRNKCKTRIMHARTMMGYGQLSHLQCAALDMHIAATHARSDLHYPCKRGVLAFQAIDGLM